MENASKALLIAGAILISIIVISIVMVYFYSGRDFTEQQIDLIDEKIVLAHNSQFNVYEREIAKSELEKLVDVVIKNNKKAKSSEFIVTIEYNGLKNEEINGAYIDSLDMFDCKMIMNSKGLINKINVTKK